MLCIPLKISSLQVNVHQKAFKNIILDLISFEYYCCAVSFSVKIYQRVNIFNKSVPTAIESFSWFWRLYLKDGRAFPQFSYSKSINMINFWVYKSTLSPFSSSGILWQKSRVFVIIWKKISSKILGMQYAFVCDNIYFDYIDVHQVQYIITRLYIY